MTEPAQLSAAWRRYLLGRPELLTGERRRTERVMWLDGIADVVKSRGEVTLTFEDLKQMAGLDVEDAGNAKRLYDWAAASGFALNVTDVAKVVTIKRQ